MPTQPPWLNPSSPTGPVTAGCLRSTASASRSSAARSSSVWVSQLPGEPPQPARSWVSTTAPSSAIRSAQPPQSSQQPSPEPSTSTSAATGSSGTCTSARSSPHGRPLSPQHRLSPIGVPAQPAAGRIGRPPGGARPRSRGPTYGSSTARSCCRISSSSSAVTGRRRAAQERRVLPLAPARRPGGRSSRASGRPPAGRRPGRAGRSPGRCRQLCSKSVSCQTRSRRSWPGRRLLDEPVLGQLPEVERAARLAHPEMPPAPGRRRRSERGQRLDEVEPQRVRQRPDGHGVRDPHDVKAIFDISRVSKVSLRNRRNQRARWTEVTERMAA